MKRTVSRRLFDADTPAVYSANHLLYVRQGTLLARPFDPVTLQLAGDPTPVAEEVTPGHGQTSRRCPRRRLARSPIALGPPAEKDGNRLVRSSGSRAGPSRGSAWLWSVLHRDLARQPTSERCNALTRETPTSGCSIWIATRLAVSRRIPKPTLPRIGRRAGIASCSARVAAAASICTKDRGRWVRARSCWSPTRPSRPPTGLATGVSCCFEATIRESAGTSGRCQ